MKTTTDKLSTEQKTEALNKADIKRCPDLKRGYFLSQRTSAAFWDSLEARTDNDLQDLLAWAKEMSQTNCGWKEFALKQALINSVADILTERKKVCV